MKQGTRRLGALLLCVLLIAADHVRLHMVDALLGQNLHACRDQRLRQPQPAVVGRYVQADQLGSLSVAGEGDLAHHLGSTAHIQRHMIFNGHALP